jgi:ribokinase
VRVAVVGHVEWVTFVRVDHPPTPGAILHGSEAWDEPAGGGGVAAVELARLAGRCTLYTGLGDDPVGQGVPAALAHLGVTVHATTSVGPQRRAVTLVDPAGERTIVVIGPAQAPAGLTLAEPTDAVYFCKGDAEALRGARQARVLVATARVLPVLQAAGVQLDALVHSAADPSERYTPGDLDPAPRVVVTTEGARGGYFRTADGQEGRYAPVAPLDTTGDAYGAGDCFAAGLAFALAEGRPLEAALAFAASRGAAALGRRGAHGR